MLSSRSVTPGERVAVRKSLIMCATCGSILARDGAPCPVCDKDDPDSQREQAVFADKYRLERTLGRGGMGTVYMATDLSLERTVALKMLHASLASEPDVVQRFEKEARMMARLEHPNLVPIYAVEKYEAIPFIVMKYLEGKTLSQARREKGRPFAAAEVTPLLAQVAAGLSFMHDKGFVHRDLKPGNLFLGGDGHLTILDLGIARDATSTLTRPGLPMGTPHYMSPEQTETTHLDLRSDLYSLAVILFELVVGKLPFAGDNEFDLMRAHRDAPVPDASVVGRTSREVAQVLTRALAKKRDERYPTARELASAWEEAARAPAPPPEAVPPAEARAPAHATPLSRPRPAGATPPPAEGAAARSTPVSRPPPGGVKLATPAPRPSAPPRAPPPQPSAPPRAPQPQPPAPAAPPPPAASPASEAATKGTDPLAPAALLPEASQTMSEDDDAGDSTAVVNSDQMIAQIRALTAAASSDRTASELPPVRGSPSDQSGAALGDTVDGSGGLAIPTAMLPSPAREGAMPLEGARSTADSGRDFTVPQAPSLAPGAEGQRRLLLGVAASAAVALLGLGAWLLWGGRRTPPEAPETPDVVELGTQGPKPRPADRPGSPLPAQDTRQAPRTTAQGSGAPDAPTAGGTPSTNAAPAPGTEPRSAPPPANPTAAVQPTDAPTGDPVKPPAPARPRTERAFAELRVLVTVGGKNGWAQVWLDGADKGYTPATLKVSPGTHALELRRPGKPSERRSLKVTPGSPTVVRVDLPP